MTKIYNNPMGRLNEARKHYKRLINEAPGFPGMCCDGGPTCIPVTFNSARDNCSNLGMDDCGHADCMGDPAGPDDGPNPYLDNDFQTGELGIQTPHAIAFCRCSEWDGNNCEGGNNSFNGATDLTVGDVVEIVSGGSSGFAASTTTDPLVVMSSVPNPNASTPFDTIQASCPNSNMISCDLCDNGSPVSQMFPGPNCPPNTIPSGTGNPCANTSDPCDFSDISGPCATQANLISQFVSGDPSQFLSNMLSWYTNPPNPMNYPYHRGCDFLEIVRQKHLGHLATGIAINTNNPNGVQMGPAWIAQKTSKVAYLDCVLSALNADNCCGSPTNPNGGNTGTGTGSPDNPITMGKKKMKTPDMVGGKKGAERKGMRK